MMEADKVSETLGVCSELSRLIARLDVVNSSRHKIFMFYFISVDSETH